MTWTCPSCGRTERLPPKWCDCQPYPITAEELMGVATYELALAGGTQRIDEATFDRLVAEHGLELSRDGEPVAPAIVRTVTTAGIEVAATEDIDWAPLPPEAIAGS